MIKSAGLWVSHAKYLFERIGGMSVLERQLWTLASAGITKVSIGARRPDDAQLSLQRLPKGLEVLWIQRKTEEKQVDIAPPYIAVSGDHFVRPDILRYAATAPYTAHTSFHDHEDHGVMQIVPFRTENVISPGKVPLAPGSSIFLEFVKLKAGPTLDWLLSLGIKSQDGFMARHFDRHISLFITRSLIETSVTPNMMTVLSCLLGLAGAVLFLFTPSYDIAAAGLIWLHSVLDGCDGELARIRFQESPLGGDIDFWGDNLVHVALFTLLAAGMTRAGHAAAPALGLSAVVGIIGSAALAFRDRVARRRAGAPLDDAGANPSLLARIETILAQRDFIYLLLVMTFFDMTYSFLWAGAVGAPLFFVMMLVAGRAGDAYAGGGRSPSRSAIQKTPEEVQP